MSQPVSATHSTPLHQFAGILTLQHSFNCRGVPLRTALRGRHSISGQAHGDAPQRLTGRPVLDDPLDYLARERGRTFEPHALSILDRQSLPGAVRDLAALQLADTAIIEAHEAAAAT